MFVEGLKIYAHENLYSSPSVSHIPHFLGLRSFTLSGIKKASDLINFFTASFLTLPFLSPSSPSPYRLFCSLPPCSSSSPQGDILTVSHKIDANWYEGYRGDQKGIFAITYIRLLKKGESHNVHCTSEC